MSKNTTPPSHRVYAVTKNGKRNFWQAIGAIWPHEDGEGFSMKLDYLLQRRLTWIGFSPDIYECSFVGASIGLSADPGGQGRIRVYPVR